MSKFIYEISHWPLDLGVLYGIALMAYVAGLVQGRAPVRSLLWSPVAIVFIMLLDSVLYEFVVGPLGYHMGLRENGTGDMLLGLLYDAVVNYGWGRFTAFRRRSGDTLYRRGAVVSPWRHTKLRGKPPAGVVTLAHVPVRPEDEAKHFKIIGATGTGKSTAIRELLSGALARGDRAIIADPDGGYLDIFHDGSRGDVILNPFEADARKWDLFGEVTELYDVEQLARSLIPDIGGEERVWAEYARTFFTAVAQQLVRVNVRDDGALYRLIRSASVEELRKLLAGTAAGPFLEEGSEKMFGSLRSVASSAVRVLEYTTEQQAQPFSVRQWVREAAARPSGRGGALFLPYRASQIAALRSVISAWMRLGIFEAMDRPAGDQRLWFVVDELDALGAIDGLKDALARLRKFGGRCVLGFQSIAQVSGTYGREVADTLVENCGNTLILRCAASERGGTSEFASKVIGQREVTQITKSHSRASDKLLATVTTAQQVKIEPAVMASEIERLPDLAGFLRLASNPDWHRVRLSPVHYPSVRRESPPRAPAGSTTASPPIAPGVPSAAQTSEAPSAPKLPARTSTRKRDSAPTRRRGRAAAQAPLPSPRAEGQDDARSDDPSVERGSPSGTAPPVQSSLGGQT